MKCVNYLKIFFIFFVFIFGSKLYSQSQIAIAGELTYEQNILPGNDESAALSIRNLGSDSVLVRVYQKDYVFYYDGTTDYPEPGTIERSNATWITYTPTRFYVPGNAEVIVNFGVQVPSSDTLAGTFWSMLMVEPMDEIVPEKKEGISVNTVIRYGIQIITNTGNTGEKNIEFLDVNLMKDEDKRVLLVDIENVGERIVRPSVWAELYDATGKKIGLFDSIMARIYPGTSIRKKIELKDVEPGMYKTIIIADCGEDDLFGLDYTLEID
ncbi:MAG: hypothetical protein R6V04_14945 [bacterium]